MNTRNIMSTGMGLLLTGAILSCSFVTSVFTGPTEKTSEQSGTADEEGSGQSTNSGEGESQESSASAQESRGPIVGTWKQVVFNGLTSAKNQQLPSHAELDGYHFFASSVGQTDLCGASHEGGGAEIWRTRDGTRWETVGKAGMGDPDQNILRLATWHDRLYVVAYGGKTFTFWVSEDGNTFRQIEGPWTNNESASLHIIDGRLFLFAETVQSQNGLQAWEISDGEKFSKIFDGGMGDATNRLAVGVLELPALDGWTYMGVGNSEKGGEVWRTKDGISWETSLTGGFDNPAIAGVFPQLAFQDRIYAGYYPYPNGVNIVRTGNGTQWEKVVKDAFGLGEHHAMAAFLKEFEDVLYLAIGNEDPRQCGPGPVEAPAAGPAVGQPGRAGTTVKPGSGSSSEQSDRFPLTGFTLWRAPDGKDWKQVGEPGFGNPNYFWAGPSVARGIFYICATNYHEGNKVWRSDDGENWEEFFTAPVSPTTYGCGITEVDDSLLYVEGDLNKGVQVWRYGQ